MAERPQEIRPPHVYGDFRPSRLERMVRDRAKPKWRKQLPGNSDAHLAMIRTLPCIIPGCTARRVDPHHLLAGPCARERGVYLKSRDRHALPLCREHHNAAHARSSHGELKFFRDHGYQDPYALGDSLYAAATRGQAYSIVITNRAIAAAQKGSTR